MPLLSRLLLTVLFALSLLDATAVAAPPADRYTAEVPVTGADAAQRDAALARAWREVGVKVSGDPRSVSRLRAVRDPAELVAQYQYAAAPGGGRTLRVTFERDAIDDLLSDEPAATPAEVKPQPPQAPFGPPPAPAHPKPAMIPSSPSAKSRGGLLQGF